MISILSFFQAKTEGDKLEKDDFENLLVNISKVNSLDRKVI